MKRTAGCCVFAAAFASFLCAGCIDASPGPSCVARVEIHKFPASAMQGIHLGLPLLQGKRCGPIIRLRGGFNMEDAEKYLSRYGIFGLPRLNVIYSSETGSVNVLAGTEDADFDCSDHWLAQMPCVDWEGSLGKCTLIMIDPDVPERVGDGKDVGEEGPYLHWLVTGASETCKNGQELVPYQVPWPLKGRHRYMLVLFRHTQATSLTLQHRERRRWDFKQFLKDNPHLEAMAFNFFYIAAEPLP